jgi:hypothetical protein
VPGAECVAEEEVTTRHTARHWTSTGGALSATAAAHVVSNPVNWKAATVELMAMTTHVNSRGRVRTPDDVDRLMAEIEKGQQLAGHFPSDDDLNRARRVITGEITADEADAEVAALHAKYLH